MILHKYINVYFILQRIDPIRFIKYSVIIIIIKYYHHHHQHIAHLEIQNDKRKHPSKTICFQAIGTPPVATCYEQGSARTCYGS